MENWTDDTRFIPTAQGLASANRAKPGTLPEVPGLVLMGPTPRLKALGDMLEERRKQEARWGPHHDAKHNAVEWCAIAQDYLGRASRLAIDAGDPDQLRRRWLQVAAILLAAVEEHDLRAATPQVKL